MFCFFFYKKIIIITTKHLSKAPNEAVYVTARASVKGQVK